MCTKPGKEKREAHVIEMVDETGQVSKKCCNKPKKFWNLQPKKLGKEDKEMAVTLVTNERSQELIWVPWHWPSLTDVISLSINQNWNCLWRRGFAWNQNWQRWCPVWCLYWGICSSLSIRLMRLKNMVTAWAWDGLLGVHGFLHINGYDH